MAGVKITITTQGDSGVGIQGECITINWPGLEDLLGDHEDSLRENNRAYLATTFTALLGDRATVTYGDECPECGRPGRQQGFGCPYVDCPDNSDAAELAATA